MSFDPDDDRWAERAAEVAVATMPEQKFTVRRRVGQFMNPWHDEIGRFAPKGYVRSGAKISREVGIPNSVPNAAVVEMLEVVYAATESGAHPVDISLRRGQLIHIAKKADQDLVERLIKPAARAIDAGRMEEAKRLIDEANGEVFSPFIEEFEVPDPEYVEVRESYEGAYYTVTPEGTTITFKDRGHDVKPGQIQTILSAATTAARAGNLTDVEFLNIEVQGHWNHENQSWDTHTMGFVNSDPTNVGDTHHRTLHLTPQLIKGNFDPNGSTPLDLETVTASATQVEPLRMTVLHEMGHISLFENAIVRKGTEGAAWFDSTMQEMADQTPMTEIPLMSVYATKNTVEMHAEAFAEWTNTGGTTNNPWVLRMAKIFNWSSPARVDQPEPALVAAGAPVESWLPVWTLPDEPFTIVDGVDGPSYVYGEAALDQGPVVASAGQFMNPWHDEIGRFAPKGTGTMFNVERAVADVLAGEPVSVSGDEALELAFAFADLDHPVDLTLVTVDGSESMFSAMRGRGVARADMPQIPKDYHADFERRLRKAGIAMTLDVIDPRELHATQSELDGHAVGEMIFNKRVQGVGAFDYLKRPLLISSDGYILDGHHRWAAAAIESAVCDGCIQIPIVRVGMPMRDLMPFAQKFTDDFDIPRRVHGDKSPGKKKKKKK